METGCRAAEERYLAAPRFIEQGWLQGCAVAIAAVVLFAILKLQLLVLLLAICSSYALVLALPNTRLLRLAGCRAKLMASVLVLIVPVGMLLAGAFAVGSHLAGASYATTAIANDLGGLLAHWRSSLPTFVLDYLPGSTGEVHPWLINLVKRQSEYLAAMGKNGAAGLLLAFVGVIIGILIANDGRQASSKPMACTIRQRVVVFQATFVDVVVSQACIAGINVGLTAIFFFVLLPLAGTSMPYAGMLLALTFVAGMLPVVGNLLCNTVIAVVAFTVSPSVAVSALVFLVLIHKLEYFVCAKVVGSRTSMAAWEVLLAIIVMEFAFGPAGLVAAPLGYAYLKREFIALKWV